MVSTSDILERRLLLTLGEAEKRLDSKLNRNFRSGQVISSTVIHPAVGLVDRGPMSIDSSLQRTFISCERHKRSFPKNVRGEK